MSMLQILQIPVLHDNYLYILHDPDAGITAAVDPAVEEPVLHALQQRRWTLSYILNTHHHMDHVGANLALKARTGCTIFGPADDQDRIPGIDHPLHDGDSVALGQTQAQVLSVPGHTRGHIAYHFPTDHALFCGDTLFSVGCGRLFEGTPQQMWTSLSRLRALPDHTRVYCAHEYTASNLRFALSIEPSHPALRARAQEVDNLRAQQQPSVPSTIGAERAINPFLRADDPLLQQSLGMLHADPVRVFAEIRRRKDVF